MQHDHFLGGGYCFDILTRPRGRECVKGQNDRLRDVLGLIPINSIRNMTNFTNEQNTV